MQQGVGSDVSNVRARPVAKQRHMRRRTTGSEQPGGGPNSVLRSWAAETWECRKGTRIGLRLGWCAHHAFLGFLGRRRGRDLAQYTIESGSKRPGRGRGAASGLGSGIRRIGVWPEDLRGQMALFDSLGTPSPLTIVTWRASWTTEYLNGGGAEREGDRDDQ